ncbi:choice-of-anchor Q domain-containing protein [Chondromyces crocatus]|uniref:choice-of-anchor Q domain-containing protein n=1 Tax=Chondromyces crocatus TaxID=52 RepID=UPI00067A8EA8|nr:choice-of-anchor Q domain-containing protein [Chondromyces crocatus]
MAVVSAAFFACGGEEDGTGPGGGGTTNGQGGAGGGGAQGGAGGAGAQGGTGGAGAQGGAGGAGAQGGAGGTAAVCGDGVVEGGETCDGDCPATCPDDGDACTEEVLSGSPETCDVVCAAAPVTACVSGDGCCPAGCSAPEDLDCVVCDVRVPDDHATIAEAIAAAPSPGVVCVRPGQYAGDVAMRPHVSLQGYGPSTEIQGNVSVRALGDADPTPTSIRDLRVVSSAGGALTTCPVNQPACASSAALAGGTLALTAERVELRSTTQLNGTMYCATLETFGGGVQIVLRDSLCAGGRGFRVVGGLPATAVSHELVAERNRFMPGPGDSIFDPIEYLVNQTGSGTCGAVTSPAGTRVKATIVNNEFYRTDYEGVYTSKCLALTAADAAASSIEVRNNSFVVPQGVSGDRANAVWVNGVAGLFPRVVVANNLYWRTNANPLRGTQPDVMSGNLLPASDPFLDVAGGSLLLAPGSAAIDAADPAHAPPVDNRGVPRPVDGNLDGISLPDVGAHEYVP